MLSIMYNVNNRYVSYFNIFRCLTLTISKQNGHRFKLPPYSTGGLEATSANASLPIYGYPGVTRGAKMATTSSAQFELRNCSSKTNK